MAAGWREDVGKVGPDTRWLDPGTAWHKAGTVVATRKLLTENKVHQATLNGLVSDLSNAPAFSERVDTEVSEASEEDPKNKAVAQVVGKMWKDMRKYGMPFFLSHVEEQQKWLQRRGPELQKELDGATAELRGHYHKLIVQATPKLVEKSASATQVSMLWPLLSLAFVLPSLF